MDDTTPTAPPPAAAPAPSGLDRFFAWLRTLDARRDTDQKWIGGVCSGLARRFNVDPVLIRAAFVVLFCLGLIGVMVYLVLWVFLPETNGSIVAERAIRQGDAWSIVLLVVLALALLGGPSVAHDWNAGLWTWWVIVPVGVLVWLLARRNRPVPPGRASLASAYAGTAGSPHTSPTAGVAGPGAPTSAAALPRSATGDTPTAFAGTTAPTVWSDQSIAPTAPVWTTASGPAGAAPGVAGATPGTAGAGPGGPPPAAPAAPWPTTPPPAPPQTRRRSAGLFGALITIGLAMAGYGVGFLLDAPTGFPGSSELLGLIGATAAAGLCVLAYGIIGRRAGLSAFIAVVLAVVTWAATIIPGAAVTDGVGDRVWYPIASADTSYSLGIGQARLDLGGLSGYVGAPRRVTASVGVGELTVVVPDGLTVQVHSTVGAGGLDTNGDGTFEQELDRNGRPGGVKSPGIDDTTVVGTGTPTVTVDAHVGLGDISIIRPVPGAPLQPVQPSQS